MSFDDLKKEFSEAKITKDQYYEKMHAFHSCLFRYPKLIGESIIKKIEIDDEEVIFKIITKDGLKLDLTCDSYDKHALPMTLLNFGEYETEETGLLVGLAGKGDVVFDIGANIGWYTINLMKRHEDIKVYSFEPIRQNYDRLVKNLAVNGLPLDKAFDFGFADYEGGATFYHDLECSMASSLVNLRERDYAVKEECRILMVDNFVRTQSLDRIDLIKCDVEGAELFVYRGGHETIRTYKPIVFTEMLRKWARKFDYHPNDIITFFTRLGYACHVMEPAGLTPIEQVTEETIQTNFVFLHREKHRYLLNG